MRDGVIHTVVSHPGTVERRIVEGLAPHAVEKRRVGGGVSLRTLEWESAGVDAELGTRLVFLHGRGHAATIWAPVLRQLEGWIAIDLPGFGHSAISPEAGEPRTQEEGLAAFVDPVEDVLTKYDERGVVIVGHSLGGLVALEIALRGRVQVRGLVLIGSMGLGPYVSPTARAFLRIGPERLAKVPLLSALSPSKKVAGSSELGALRDELYRVRRHERVTAKAAFDTMVPLFGDAMNRRDRLGEIAVPTLLLWGEHDEAFPLPIAIDAQTRIRGSELEVVRGAKHSPHVEEPEAVVRAVRAFLSRKARL